MLILWLIVLLAALYLLLGGLIFSAAFTQRAWPLNWLTRNRPLAPGWDEQIRQGMAQAKALPHEDLWISSRDGLRLHAYWIPAENARRTILCAHGFHGSPFRDFSGAATLFHSLGCNLLLIDQRSSGQSEGRYLTFGIREKYDLQAWLFQLEDRMGPEHPLYLDGISMGATTVMWTLGLELPSSLRGAIADCGYTCVPEIISHTARQLLGISAGWLLPAAALWVRVLAGVNIYKDHTRLSLARNRRPVLIAHGMADSLVPFHMGQENAAYARCEHPVFAPDAGHGLTYFYAYDEYLQEIKALFSRCENGSEK